MKKFNISFENTSEGEFDSETGTIEFTVPYKVTYDGENYVEGFFNMYITKESVDFETILAASEV